MTSPLYDYLENISLIRLRQLIYKRNVFVHRLLLGLPFVLFPGIKFHYGLEVKTSWSFWLVHAVDSTICPLAGS